MLDKLCRSCKRRDGMESTTDPAQCAFVTSDIKLAQQTKERWTTAACTGATDGCWLGLVGIERNDPTGLRRCVSVGTPLLKSLLFWTIIENLLLEPLDRELRAAQKRCRSTNIRAIPKMRAHKSGGGADIQNEDMLWYRMLKHGSLLQ